MLMKLFLFSWNSSNCTHTHTYKSLRIHTKNHPPNTPHTNWMQTTKYGRWGHAQAAVSFRKIRWIYYSSTNNHKHTHDPLIPTISTRSTLEQWTPVKNCVSEACLIHLLLRLVFFVVFFLLHEVPCILSWKFLVFYRRSSFYLIKKVPRILSWKFLVSFFDTFCWRFLHHFLTHFVCMIRFYSFSPIFVQLNIKDWSIN